MTCFFPLTTLWTILCANFGKSKTIAKKKSITCNSNTYTNKTWSDVSGIALSEINLMEREFLQGVEHALYIDFGTYQRWGKLLGGLLLAKERDKGTWRRRYAAPNSSFLHQQYELQQQRQLQQRQQHAYPSPPQTIHDKQQQQQQQQYRQQNSTSTGTSMADGGVWAATVNIKTGVHQSHPQSQSRADGLPVHKPHGHQGTKAHAPSHIPAYSSRANDHHRHQPHANHDPHHRITPSSSGSSSRNGGNINKYGHGRVHHQRTRTRARSISPVSSVVRLPSSALHHVPIPPCNSAPSARHPQQEAQYHEYDYPFTFAPPSHAPQVKLDHHSHRPLSSSNAVTMVTDTKMDDAVQGPTSASAWNGVVPPQQQYPPYRQQQQPNQSACAGTKRIAAEDNDQDTNTDNHRTRRHSPTSPNKIQKLADHQHYHRENRDPQVVGQQLAQLSLANPNANANVHTHGPPLPPIITSSLISGGGGSGNMSSDISPADANPSSTWARGGGYSNSVDNSPESSSTTSGSIPLFVDAASTTNIPSGTVVVPPAEPTLQRTLQAAYALDVSKWESRRAVPQVGFFFLYFMCGYWYLNSIEQNAVPHIQCSRFVAFRDAETSFIEVKFPTAPDAILDLAECESSGIFVCECSSWFAQDCCALRRTRTSPSTLCQSFRTEASTLDLFCLGARRYPSSTPHC